MFGKKIQKDLFKLADSNYSEFQIKLGCGNDELINIGIRNPILREFSKKLSKEYELDYLLENINEKYYEEIMLKAMLIGNEKKLTFDELEQYIRNFVPKIVDWAICDTFCSELKITKKYKEQMWVLIQEYLESEEEFELRFALVMLLNYFMEEDYIDEIYDIINNVSNDAYYVKMANAWLLSYCIIKFYNKTIDYLKNYCTLKAWTFNKGIQKGIESRRITEKQRNELRKLKK